MKLSPHFNRSEFACNCGCGFDTVDTQLIIVAEVVREYIGPFSPASACRCVEYNKKVGGTRPSQHLLGRAIDIHTNNPIDLYNYLNSLYPDSMGLGLYSWGVHIDTRGGKARWSSY